VQKPSNVIGQCGLCDAPHVALCYSDLLPKAIARWVRLNADPNGDNPNPVYVTLNVAKAVNFRVAEYLLCPECEDRLNKGGEMWTLANAYRGKGKFPLREFVSQGSTRISLQNADLIDAKDLPNIKLEKLIYFSISIFWKACSRRWQLLDRKVQLEFGPYEERFRQFLLGQPFPDTAAVLISISADPAPHLAAVYPHSGGRVQGTRQYRFGIPGMTVWLQPGANFGCPSGNVRPQIRRDFSGTILE
jgi:hypothetical protein